jgi:hypothetical protein
LNKDNKNAYLIAFESFKWTDNKYELPGATQDSKSFKNKAFAVAGASTKNRVISVLTKCNCQASGVYGRLKEATNLCCID